MGEMIMLIDFREGPGCSWEGGEGLLLSDFGF